MTLKYSVDSAYQYCLAMAQRHYENFPVAGYLLPKRLRYPVAAIYAFARSADDLADEGNETEKVRLQQLEQYSGWIDEISQGTTPDNPIFIALQDTITRHQLPVSLFHDLLAAFKQDVSKQRYDTYEDLLWYCRHSANPVGRLMLHLYQQTSEAHLQQSDAICTGLQLINFYQDLVQDYQENNRIYIPQQDCQRFGVTEKHFRERITDTAMQKLMAFEYERTYNLFITGRQLGLSLKGRIGFNMRAIYLGGMRILQRLQNNNHNVFRRPRLNKYDGLSILWHALIKQLPDS
jgi:squalene synthase HpnC